jgi:hypothetical protein
VSFYDKFTLIFKDIPFINGKNEKTEFQKDKGNRDV